ncbi:MAG: oligosaccharide flippase family protein [Lacunisphaera sp.]
MSISKSQEGLNLAKKWLGKTELGALIIRIIQQQFLSEFRVRLLTNVSWSLIGEVASKGLLLAATVFVARMLGREEYGEFGLVRTTIMMFATFGGMGLGLTANRYVAQFRDDNKSYCGKILGLSYGLSATCGLLMGIGVFVASNYLSQTVMNAPQLAGALRLAAAMLFLSAINGAQIGILQGLEAYRRIALSSLVQGLSAIILLPIGAYYLGRNGALIGLLGQIAISTLVLQRQVSARLNELDLSISYEQLGETLPLLWRFSIPAALCGIAVAPFKWLVESMLARDSGFGQLGIFSATMTVTAVFITVGSTLNAPLITLAAHSGRGNDKIQHLTMYGSWYLFFVMALPCTLFPELMQMFGKAFSGREFSQVMLLLLIYCGLQLYYQGLMRIFAIGGSLWFAFATNIFEGLSLYIFFAYFTDHRVIDLAWAYVVSYVVRIAVSIPLLLKYRTISPSVLRDWRFVLTFTVLGLLVGFRYFSVS